jgi:hypothetical protein
MSHDTRVRIVMSVLGMLLGTVLVLPLIRAHVLPLWMYGGLLAIAAVTGLLSPEIERGWERSDLPLSERWRNRRR